MGEQTPRRPWSVIEQSGQWYVSRLDNGPAYRSFDAEEAHALVDALNSIDGLWEFVRAYDAASQGFASDAEMNAAMDRIRAARAALGDTP